MSPTRMLKSADADGTALAHPEAAWGDAQKTLEVINAATGEVSSGCENAEAGLGILMYGFNKHNIRPTCFTECLSKVYMRMPYQNRILASIKGAG